MVNIQDVSDGQDHLMIEAKFGSEASATVLFDHFTKASLITTWWAQEAEIDGREGGTYSLRWPGPGFQLVGRFTTFERPQRLAYTWRWEQIAGCVERRVEIIFEDGGLRLTHGEYGEGEVEREDRQSHVDGWLYFLAALGETLDPR